MEGPPQIQAITTPKILLPLEVTLHIHSAASLLKMGPHVAG